MGQSFGLEHALWFADSPEDAWEDPTFERNRSHDYVARECETVRNGVGGIELANFAKHSITGPGARDWLNRTMAGHVPKPGRLTLTPMLTEKGRLYGDLTVACLGDEDFMLFGSGAMQDAHSRFFARTLPDTVRHQNETGGWHGIGLAGPQSRGLLQRITRLDVSADALKFRDTRRTFVGGVPVILNRLSFSGELGFEIYCRPQFLLLLSEAIEEAGADLDYRWYGARTLMSLRLEKGWGAWGLEFRPDFNAVESGMDVFINWNKDFVGKEATARFRDEGVDRKLVTLTVDTPMDVTLDEAVLVNDAAVGYITSGAMRTTWASPWPWPMSLANTRRRERWSTSRSWVRGTLLKCRVRRSTTPTGAGCAADGRDRQGLPARCFDEGGLGPWTSALASISVALSPTWCWKHLLA